MARHKDVNWNLQDGKPNPDGSGGRVHERASIQIALLMDLRDELKELNQHFAYRGSLLRDLRGLRRDIKKLSKEAK